MHANPFGLNPTPHQRTAIHRAWSSSGLRSADDMEREVDSDAGEEGHDVQRPEKRQRRSEQPVQEQIVKPFGAGTSARALRSVLRGELRTIFCSAMNLRHKEHATPKVADVLVRGSVSSTCFT